MEAARVDDRNGLEGDTEKRLKWIVNVGFVANSRAVTRFEGSVQVGSFSRKEGFVNCLCRLDLALVVISEARG